MRAIPFFRGARLNDCAKASSTVSAGKDGRGDSGGGAGGGGLRAVAGYAYDMAAGSVESGQTAVGKISGVIPVAFGKADLTKALRNSGLADTFRGPLKIDGIAIGIGAAFGSIMLTEHDHPKNDNRTFIDQNGVRHAHRAIASDNDSTSFTSPAGGASSRWRPDLEINAAVCSYCGRLQGACYVDFA